MKTTSSSQRRLTFISDLVAVSAYFSLTKRFMIFLYYYSIIYRPDVYPFFFVYFAAIGSNKNFYESKYRKSNQSITFCRIFKQKGPVVKSFPPFISLLIYLILTLSRGFPVRIFSILILSSSSLRTASFSSSSAAFSALI